VATDRTARPGGRPRDGRAAAQARPGPGPLHLALRGLGERKEAAVEPVYRAFRVDMASWPVEQLLHGGKADLAMIERQLARTGTRPA
jgi:hypothetical protein